MNTAERKPDILLEAVPAAPPARVVYNDDGSAVVRLAVPVMFRGEKHTRVTIPAIKGRHMKHAPMLDEDITVGDLVTWASKIVEPLGIVDELDASDAVDVATELADAVGKSRARGGHNLP